MRYWLKQLRKQKKMTHETAANASGISRQYYSFIEGGRRRPSPQVAIRIGKALDFDWTQFYDTEAQQ